MVDDLAAHRWDKVSNPSEHKPLDALKAAIRDIESGAIDPHHIIVVYCTNDGELGKDGLTGFYQAGKMNGYFGALGLLTRALQIMGSGA